MDLLVHIENVLMDGSFHSTQKFQVFAKEFQSEQDHHNPTILFSFTLVDLQVWRRLSELRFEFITHPSPVCIDICTDIPYFMFLLL